MVARRGVACVNVVEWRWKVMGRKEAVNGDSESVAAFTGRMNRDSLRTFHPCMFGVRPVRSEMCVDYRTVGTKGNGHQDQR